MAGTKRSSDGTFATRSTKVPRMGEDTSPKAKGGKRGVKTNIATSAFMANALPITVNITNTPPPIVDEDTVPATSADPGYIGGVKCLPSLFSTGSYGWKGSKRLTIEVPNDTGGMEKVQVQVTINATVVGSKNAPEAPAGDKAEEKHEQEEGKGKAPVEETAAAPAVEEEKAE